MTEDKSSNLVIFGIVAAFFAYLIYIKSKDISITSPVVQPTYQPIQQIQPSQQSYIDSIQLYNIQLQTQQINDTLKMQMDQIRSIQEQQLKQSESIIKLENVKCSNIVSMDSNNNYNTLDNNNNYNSPNSYNPVNNINPIKNIRLSNVSRENDELIANRIFGMK